MASEAVLGLIIEADNRASRALDTVTGDIDDMSDAAERANKKFAGLKSAMGTGLKVAGVAAAAGFAAVSNLMGSSVRSGAQAEEALAKFNVVFADTEGTAAAVTAEMDAFAKASGRNKYVLREMASGFGDVLKPMGYSVEEAGNLSTEMTQLAVDLGSFNSSTMTQEESYDRLSSTLVGNHANALAFGVIINESILQQELMTMGADELTGAQLEQAKVQARINILMRGTTDAQGDAVRTGDSFTNTMKRLTGTIEETQTALGLRLLPVFTPLLAAFTDLAEVYIPKAADALAGFVEGIDIEKVKGDLDAFLAGLTEGDLVLPGVKIEFKTPDADAEGGESWMKPFLPSETFSIDMGKFFTWDSATWFETNTKSVTLDIGEWLAGSPITVSSVTTEGVIVEKKLAIGDFIDAQWIDDQGWVKLKIGDVDFAAAGFSWEELFAGAGTALMDAIKADVKAAGGIGAFLIGDVGKDIQDQIDGAADAENPTIGVQAYVKAVDWGEQAHDYLVGAIIEEDAVVWGTHTHVYEGGSAIAEKNVFWGDWVGDYEARADIPYKNIDWGDHTFTYTVRAEVEEVIDFMNESQGNEVNATGTSFFRGGMTMVGETGPELVNLPRGSQIHSAGQTAQMAMGGVTVNVAATVNNEQDAYVLARQVANILQRGY